VSETHHAPLGELLIQHGGMSEEHLRAALEEQHASGRPLGEIVVERGYVPAAMVAQALATQQGRLTKTEYGYATGWEQAIDERDQAIAELRRWAESANTAIAERDAEIQRLGGELAAATAGGEAVEELRAAIESRDAEIDRLAGELAGLDQLRAALADRDAEIAAGNDRAAAVQGRTELQEREAHDLRRQLEHVASRATALAERAEAAEQQVEELQAAAATSRDPWADAASHLLFVRRPDGYALVERDGPPPAAGAAVDGAVVQRVAALGGKPCAYLID
jgi:DNA repair exonuclease SbcCD ATPase subunit